MNNVENTKINLKQLVMILFFVVPSTFTLTKIYDEFKLLKVELKAEQELRQSEDARIEDRMEKKTKRNTDNINKHHE